MGHTPIGSKPEKIDKVIIFADAFRKNDNGSWECIKNTDIKTPSGIHRLNAGMVFKQSNVQWGVNIFEMLEKGETV